MIQDPELANDYVKPYPIGKPNARTHQGDSSDMVQLQKEYIALDAQYLVNNPELFVTVTGYASHVGHEDFNKELSLKRARAVKNALVKMNASLKSRIKIEGVGSSKSSEFKTNAKARCVEITIDNNASTCNEPVASTQVSKL